MAPTKKPYKHKVIKRYCPSFASRWGMNMRAMMKIMEEMKRKTERQFPQDNLLVLEGLVGLGRVWTAWRKNVTKINPMPTTLERQVVAIDGNFRKLGTEEMKDKLRGTMDGNLVETVYRVVVELDLNVATEGNCFL